MTKKTSTPDKASREPWNSRVIADYEQDRKGTESFDIPTDVRLSG